MNLHTLLLPPEDKKEEKKENNVKRVDITDPYYYSSYRLTIKDSKIKIEHIATVPLHFLSYLFLDSYNSFIYAFIVD